MGVRTIAALGAGLLLMLTPVIVTAAPFEEDLLIQINQYRVENGLAPLGASRNYDRLAAEHSQAMRQANQLSHDGFKQRFARARATSCVENVGWNHQTPLSQFNGWKESPGHNRNLLAAGLLRAGIGKTGPYVTFFACN
ncbi:CAP domain-containing protein [Geobacter sp. SVR]|uniref:CAP domain-containing protein n=1 Tax=Geobacter sp. SVR TaxID=2495594 RepID=UPI00143F0063|nr:CAP domain-containing protein [Geobacter sp. SVR]BCS55449.1 hypothetical protein GSVR_37570 [Geobacter sp. SVR]GCF83452.1 hypothetical protein GSbR_00520 [Geobacter sp. SVR]